MFETFDFSILDDPEFKEDAVREELIAPILKRLGYSATGEHRIIRSRNVTHPFVMIGSKKHPLSIIPDYLMKVGEKIAFVLDAKSPVEQIFKSKNVEQVFSYAIHPEIRVNHYALCNGREITIYNISESDVVLRCPLENINDRWEDLKSLLSPESILETTVALVSELDMQIELLMKMFESHQLDATIFLVESIREDQLYLSASPIQKAKLSSIKAQCCLATGNNQEAVIEMRAAVELCPENTRYRSNASVAALLSNEFDLAIELARAVLEMLDRDENAALTIIQSLDSQDNYISVKDFVKENSWLHDSAMCCACLSKIEFRQNHYQLAIEYAKRSLKIDKHLMEGLQALFRASFQPIRDRVLRESIISQDHQTRRQLQRSEGAMNRAAKSSVRISTLHEILHSRAAVRSARGRPLEAIADCDLILGDRPSLENKEASLLSRGSFLISLGRYVEAIQSFEALTIEDRKSESLIGLATCYIEVGLPDKAIAILEGKLDITTCSMELFHLASILIRAQREQYETDAVANILSKLQKNCPDHPQTATLLAQDRRERGDVVGAIQLLVDTIDKEHGASKTLLLIQLGHIYHLEDRKLDAIKAWQDAGPENLSDLYRDAYIEALYSSSQLQSALLNAQKMRRLHGFRPRVAEVEAAICAYIGDYKSARDLFAQLSHNEPNNYIHKVREAEFSLAANDMRATRTIVEKIHYHNVRDDAFWLRRIAALQTSLGLYHEALRFAFRSLQIDFNNPESHRFFVSTFVNAPLYDHQDSKTNRAAFSSPAPGIIPRTICIKPVNGDDNLEKGITITLEGPFTNEYGFYSPKGNFAQKILSSRKGDIVLWPATGTEDVNEWEVTEILHPYAYAFQKAGHTSEKLFGDKALLKSMDISDGIEKLFAIIDKSKEFDNNIFKKYDEWLLPFSSVSKITDRSMPDVWEVLTNQPHLGIHATYNSKSEMEYGLNLLGLDETKKTLVLDFTALLTLVSLDITDLIAPYFVLLTPSSIAEQLKLLIREQSKAQTNNSNLFTGNRHRTDQKTILLQKLLIFVENNTQLLPSVALLGFPVDDVTDWEMMFERTTIDAMSLAHEHKALIYTDDARIRVLFKEKLEVEGTTTQWILTKLFVTGSITKEVYFNALEKLSLSNFKFMALLPNFYIWLLEKHKNTTSNSIRSAFRHLEGPFCNEFAAILCTSAIIKYIWSIDVSDQWRSNILSYCLQSLTTERAIHRVIRLLKYKIQNGTSDSFSHEDIIQAIRYISLWERNINFSGLNQVFKHHQTKQPFPVWPTQFYL